MTEANDPTPDERIRRLEEENARLRGELEMEKVQSLEWIRVINTFQPGLVMTPDELDDMKRTAVPSEVVMAEIEAILQRKAG